MKNKNIITEYHEFQENVEWDNILDEYRNLNEKKNVNF
jgi:hypothetical protein